MCPSNPTSFLVCDDVGNPRNVPFETLSVKSWNSESALCGTAHRVVFPRATAGDINDDLRE